jgi:hypothetical protein
MKQVSYLKLGISLIALFFLPFIVSCGGMEVRTNFSPGKYELVCPNRPLKPQPAFVLLKEKTLNSKPISPDWIRSQEITTSLNDMINLLRTSGLFASVEILNSDAFESNGILIDISLAEQEDAHNGSTAGKVFASGALTLGLAPAVYDYTYTSTMKLKVITLKGQILEKTFSKKADVSAEHYPSDKHPERVLARKYVTDENNKAAVAYLVEMSQSLY